MTVHWCGTGLSAIPGLRRLLMTGADVVVWDKTAERALTEVGDLTRNRRAFSLAALDLTLQPGDVAVSMLPGEWHVPVDPERRGIRRGAPMETGSRIAWSSWWT